MPAQITVLVVEDEPLIRMDIGDELADRGFVVLEAANAHEAMLILEARRDVNLLFTDVDMPGSMNGLRLAAAVRDRWPPVRIIVTSGHRHVGQNEMPAASRFFEKPYDVDKVADAVQEMVVAH